MTAILNFGSKFKLKNDTKPLKEKDRIDYGNDNVLDTFKDLNIDDSAFDNRLDKVTNYLDSVLKNDWSGGKVPEGYREIQRYSLVPPFCYVSILQNNEFSDVIYNVDELPLNDEELKIYRSIKELLEKEIDSPRMLDNVELSFSTTVSKLLKEHFMGKKEQGILLEKVKYYLRRDIVGFGPIDPLFHDPFIEDITCGGAN